MKLRLIVGVVNNCYMHNGKIVSTTATLLKRKSNGELSDMIEDPDLYIENMNLSQYENGVYELSTCDHSYDYESGILDDYELCLIPYRGSHENY